MTTLSNEQVLGELGWTMELIHNSTGGRLPKYWRPPFGDSDERVRAIAKEIFGLRTVIWNQECVYHMSAAVPIVDRSLAAPRTGASASLAATPSSRSTQTSRSGSPGPSRPAS